MEFEIKVKNPSKKTVCLMVSEELLKSLIEEKSEIGQKLKNLSFKGEKDKSCVFTVEKPSFTQVLVTGLGKEEKIKLEQLRDASAGFLGYTKSKTRDSFSILIPILKKFGSNEVTQAIAEGILLGGYEFNKYITKKEDKFEVKKIELVIEDKKDVNQTKNILKITKNICDDTNMVRDLVNENSSIVTPVKMAEVSKKIAKKRKLKCKVYNEKELKKLGLNMMLEVGKSGTSPPRLIILEYTGNKKSKKKILLAGKGVCFDSGGLDLKPYPHMHEMRSDMAGAATVLGVMSAISQAKVKQNVIGVLGCVENLISEKAYRPGDIIKSYSGKTIEVLNTDAEGRLVLGDALAFSVKKYNPELVIDLATLTGACVMTFGVHVAGAVTSTERHFEKLKKIGLDLNERVWELPNYEEYAADIKSDRADIRNISKSGKAGTITAGMFLKEFVGDKPWIHLDIAGTAFLDKPNSYFSAGATGFGVRLLTKFLDEI